MSLDHRPNNVNDAQWQAITHEGSHLLICAGPGTGKTHVLTHRIAYIAQKYDAYESISAITFTIKAANEMRERLKKRLANEAEKIVVGTFHAFCLQTLQQYITSTKLPVNFAVANQEQVDALTKNLWKDKKKTQRKQLLEEISRFKSNNQNGEIPDYVLTYNRLLRENNYLDFDDLLFETVRLLETNEAIRKEIQNKYCYIFVDEYQDINEIQNILLKILVGEETHITAIGDPNQAIYGFRGSDIRFFESFKNDFSGATVLSLEENYRSASNLLTASGQVIKQGGFSFVPDLTAKIYREGHLTVYEAPTDKAEAEYVVHQIEKMVGGTSMFSQDSGRVTAEQEGERTFGDIAVLYRLNSQKRVLMEAFERSGIPCQEYFDYFNDPEGLDTKFKDRIENVSLLTLHAAKGLEFSVVFIVGCEENIIPLKLNNLISDTDEERRLFYVGMTRAKEELYLIRAKKRYLFGKSYKNAPSPFLADIDKALKAYETIVYRRKSQKNRTRKQQLSLFDKL